MQEKQIEKGALLLQWKGKSQTVQIKEVTPLGVKFDYYVVGQFAGIFNANGSHTNNIFSKYDGTMDWESKGVMTTTDADIILLLSRGTGKDVPNSRGNVTAEGEGVFVTPSPRFSWLNNKKCRLEIAGSSLTGEEQAKIIAL